MAQTGRAVVAGHLCVDVIPDLSGISPENFWAMFVPGRLLTTGPVTYATGGAVSNTGLALHRLGIDTRLMGKIGADLFGQAIRQIVSRFEPGLAEGLIVDPAASSSYTIVISPPGVDRIFLHCPGPNDTFTVEDVRYDLVAGADLFHFGYPPLMKLMFAAGGSRLAEIFRRAKATGATTSLDMALPDRAAAAGRADWPGLIGKTLPYVDIFLPSIEEILFMLRRKTYEALSRQQGSPDILPLVTPQLLSDLSRDLLELGAKIVGLKLGDRGLYLRTADRTALAGLGRAAPANLDRWAGQELWAPCFKVPVVGTTGAGDATIAGFLAGLLRNLPPEEAVTAAVAVGACNIEAADALGGLRSWEETLERVEAGWERHRLRLDAPGWEFDDSRQLWRKP
jgi:sugar/nucleoside kinase (ribokinase family)